MTFSLRGSIVAIVLAIIGSALWENLFRDLLNAGAKTLLTISTLGLEVYKNDIYLDIAKGFYEQVSIVTLNLGLGVLFGAVFASIILSFVVRGKEGENKESKIKTWMSNHKRLTRSAAILYIVFVMCIALLNVTKLAYVNMSIAYYRQLESIASPYLTPHDEKIFNSRFAKISNRQDYVDVIGDLTALIISKGEIPIKPPSFIF